LLFAASTVLRRRHRVANPPSRKKFAHFSLCDAKAGDDPEKYPPTSPAFRAAVSLPLNAPRQAAETFARRCRRRVRRAGDCILTAYLQGVSDFHRVGRRAAPVREWGVGECSATPVRGSNRAALR
jgi:hypothetical protein